MSVVVYSDKTGVGGSSILVATLVQEATEAAFGGSASTNTAHTRVLDTLGGDHAAMGLTVASNVFTLANAGTYVIEWSSPALASTYHQSYLYSNTATAIVKEGSSEYSASTTLVHTRSVGQVVVTQTGSVAYTLRHHTVAARATDGLGTPTANTTNNPALINIYAQVKITKLR